MRPGLLGAGGGSAGALVSYGTGALTAVDAASGERFQVVDDVYGIDLVGSWSPTGWLQLSVDVPIVGFGGVGFDGVDPIRRTGGGLADTHVRAQLQLIRPDRDDEGVSLSILPTVDLPTGWSAEHFGRRAFAGGGRVAAGWSGDRLATVANVGIQLEPSSDDVPSASSALVDLGASFRVDDGLSIGAEFLSAVPVAGDRKGLRLEAVGSAQLAQRGGAMFVGGVAVGLTRTIGLSPFRVFLGGAFGKGPTNSDRDADGVIDAFDECPMQGETRNNLDDEDGCPDRRPRIQVRALWDGRPLEGVAVDLEGPVSRTFRTSGRPFVMDVEPASIWKATGRTETCLMGTGLATVREEDTTLDVTLETKTFGIANVRVIDATGRPADGARVSMASDELGCVPSGPMFLEADGSLDVPVGPGEHVVRVVYGTQTAESTFVAQQGKTFEVFLVVQ